MEFEPYFDAKCQLFNKVSLSTHALGSDLRRTDLSMAQLQGKKLRNANLLQVNVSDLHLSIQDLPQIVAISLCPVTSKLAQATPNSPIKIWNTSTGCFEMSVPTFELSVCDLAWSPDGVTLAVATLSYYFIVWNIRQRKMILSLQDRVFQQKTIAYLPGGDKLLTLTSSTVMVWSSATGELLSSFKTSVGIDCFAIGSKWSVAILSLSNSFLESLNLITGNVCTVQSAHRVSAIAIAPDDSRLAVANSTDHICIFSVAHLKSLFTLAAFSSVTSLTWLPNSKAIVLMSLDGAVVIWNVKSRQPIVSWLLDGMPLSFRNYAGAGICSVRSARVKKVLIAEEFDQRVVDQPSEKELTACKFDNDGEVLATGYSDGTILLWDVHSGQVLSHYPRHKGVVTSLSLSSDLLVSGSNNSSVIVWQLPRHKRLHAFRLDAPVVSLVLSPDTTMLGCISESACFSLWTIANPFTAERKYQCVGASAFAFSPMQPVVSIGCTGGRVIFINVHDLTVVKELAGPAVAVTQVAFSLDGSLLAGQFRGKEIRIWETEEYRIVTKLPNSIAMSGTLRFCSGNLQLLVGYMNNKALHVYDLTTAQAKHVIPCPESSLFDVRVNLNGELCMCTVWKNAFETAIQPLPVY